MDGAGLRMKRRVLIVGGGLAGIAAAIRLAEDGFEPVLLETRRKLGGRATSFDDQRSGTTLDNCQHVLMGCCTNLQDLYQRLGVLDRIGWHEQLHWYREDGGIDSLSPTRLPAPLHQARSFRRMKLLDSAAKREVRRAMIRMIRMGHKGRLQWQDRTFLDLLSSLGQSPGTVQLFWDTIIISACNLGCDRVAAIHGIQVFQEAFLPSRFAGIVGIPDVPLRDLYDPARALIEEAGGTIEVGCSVRSISFEDRQVSGVVTSDGPLQCPLVVTTVPPDRLLKLLPERVIDQDSRTRHLDAFESSPILGVHLLVDEPVTDLPHLVLAGRPVHWVFNKGIDERGHQHLHAVISAADAWMDLDEDTIIKRVLEELDGPFPSLGERTLVSARTVKEKRATFAATPEIEPLRPSAGPSVIGPEGGDLQGLYLAGDWCATGWPATMEGAVRSGYLAAEAISGSGGLIEELPTGRLASLLGLR